MARGGKRGFEGGGVEGKNKRLVPSTLPSPAYSTLSAQHDRGRSNLPGSDD